MRVPTGIFILLQQTHHRKAANLLTLFRLHSALSSGHPSVLSLGLNESEGLAVYSATETLLGDDLDSKIDVVKSYISEEGEIHGVPCKYLAPRPSDV